MARNIYCTVVEVPVVIRSPKERLASRDLLPWADPYIARLIRNLQDEVREERAARREKAFSSPALIDPLHSELAPTPDDDHLDFSDPDFESWQPEEVAPDRGF